MAETKTEVTGKRWDTHDDVDYSHLAGYGEMDVLEVNGVEFGGNEGHEVHIVMVDSVGNKRIGKIPYSDLREAFREAHYEFYCDY